MILFRKGEDYLTKQLHERLMSRKKIYVVPGAYCEQFVIRFVVCSRFMIQEDVEFAWNEINSQAGEVLQTNSQFLTISRDFDISLKKPGDIVSRIKDFEVENRKQNLKMLIK